MVVNDDFGTSSDHQLHALLKPGFVLQCENYRWEVKASNFLSSNTWLLFRTEFDAIKRTPQFGLLSEAHNDAIQLLAAHGAIFGVELLDRYYAGSNWIVSSDFTALPPAKPTCANRSAASLKRFSEELDQPLDFAGSEFRNSTPHPWVDGPFNPLCLFEEPLGDRNILDQYVLLTPKFYQFDIRDIQLSCRKLRSALNSLLDSKLPLIYLLESIEFLVLDDSHGMQTASELSALGFQVTTKERPEANTLDTSCSCRECSGAYFSCREFAEGLIEDRYPGVLTEQDSNPEEDYVSQDLLLSADIKRVLSNHEKLSKSGVFRMSILLRDLPRELLKAPELLTQFEIALHLMQVKISLQRLNDLNCLREIDSLIVIQSSFPRLVQDRYPRLPRLSPNTDEAMKAAAVWYVGVAAENLSSRLNLATVGGKPVQRNRAQRRKGRKGATGR
jgi:hypothetical protein